MVLNYLFTGLIAALLSVPGTGQKEVATVGEEPVVKEIKTEQADLGVQSLASLYWYNVDANGKTTGGHAHTGTKDQVLQMQGCNDQSAEICLFGSDNPSLPNGTDATGADDDHRINKTP